MILCRTFLFSSRIYVFNAGETTVIYWSSLSCLLMTHADLSIFILLLVCCSPFFAFLPNRTLLRRFWLCVRRVLFWHANCMSEGVKRTIFKREDDTRAAARTNDECTPPPPTRFNTLTRATYPRPSSVGDVEPWLWSHQARYCRPSAAVRRPPASGADKSHSDTIPYTT